MSDLISRALLCGLGLASMTQDAIRKTAQELVDQSKIPEEEGRKLVEDFQRRAVQAQAALEEKVEQAVHKAMKQLKAAAGKASPKKSAKTSGASKASARKASRKKPAK